MVWRPPLVVAAALLLAGPTVHAQEPPARIDLDGRVIDAVTGEPVDGVVVRLPELGRDAVSNVFGAFRLAGLTSGIHRFELLRLGYVELNVQVEITEPATVVFELIAKPIVLEGIEVVIDKLEDRRRSVPYTVHAFGPERLARLGAPSLEDFIRYRSGLAFVDCPRPRRSIAPPRRDCLLSRGRGVPLQVWVDETPQMLGIEVLHAYDPQEIHTLEVIPGCGMVRVYTRRFMERVAQGRGTLAEVLLECWG